MTGKLLLLLLLVVSVTLSLSVVWRNLDGTHGVAIFGNLLEDPSGVHPNGPSEKVRCKKKG